MDKVKWFTQRITGILVVFIVAIVLVASAQLLKALGLWAAVDSIFAKSLTWFWLAIVVTRALFGAAWGCSTYWIVNTGEKAGFFWFKPERARYSEEDVDKSGVIAGYVTITFCALAIVELAIRLATLTMPPYVTPQG